MKLNTLQFGKAMSAALFVLLLSVAGMKNALAQTQVATLQHNDSISAFYGMNALVEAHAAAADGDIITLSSGTFTKTNITKAITLHGAGCTSDTLGITPTFVAGDFNIEVLNTTSFLAIEGICFQGTIIYKRQLYHAKFIKCNFSSILNNGVSGVEGGGLRDVQFIDCLIGNIRVASSTNSVSIINCAIGSLRSLYYGGTSFNVYNSVIKIAKAESNTNSNQMYLYNCIVGSTIAGSTLAESSAYNCIVIGTVFSSSVQTFNCMSVDSYSEVFESFDGTFSFDADYSLKEEIATSFLGNDGREVGIYGGAMPYNPRPSYLILNRCNVANRSTIDGKLSVDIEVITSE